MQENNLDKFSISLRLIYKGFELKSTDYLYVNKFEKKNIINVLIRFNTIKSYKNTQKLDKLIDKAVKNYSVEEVINDEHENNFNLDNFGLSQQTLNQVKMEGISKDDVRRSNLSGPSYIQKSNQKLDINLQQINEEKHQTY